MRRGPRRADRPLQSGTAPGRGLGSNPPDYRVRVRGAPQPVNPGFPAGSRYEDRCPAHVRSSGRGVVRGHRRDSPAVPMHGAPFTGETVRASPGPSGEPRGHAFLPPRRPPLQLRSVRQSHPSVRRSSVVRRLLGHGSGGSLRRRARRRIGCGPLVPRRHGRSSNGPPRRSRVGRGSGPALPSEFPKDAHRSEPGVRARGGSPRRAPVNSWHRGGRVRSPRGPCAGRPRIEMSRWRHLSVYAGCPWQGACRGASALAAARPETRR